MAQCQLCRNKSPDIAKALGVCLNCIRHRSEESIEIAARVHRKSRASFDLPVAPPKDPGGLPCNICVNECRIPENGSGYCGLRRNQKGCLRGTSAAGAKLSWYHDPLPTNCVADWVCAGGTGAGYPTHANCAGAEYGYKNLAVFFQACSFNCLFCQNWHFKNETGESPTHSVGELISDVDQRTACICYFGGDPAPQLPFTLKASHLANKEHPERILRFCWETNGSMNPELLNQMMDLAVSSGGCVKFDLKAWDENLHIALTGITNRQTLANFSRAARYCARRTDPPVLIANTLIVPGYIDESEVQSIASFIAGLDPDIPYSLLAFHPLFCMSDLPLTSRDLAESCLKAAKNAGLKNVRIGNMHLLI